MRKLREQDAELFAYITDELHRQQNKWELIASENFVSEAVLEAQGSILTNKYAEGYPGKRYYGGCQFVDKVENLARDRAKELFGCDHVNVQPHSGSQANFGVYFALLKPNDTIMGMDLSHGGHLTHGSPVNVSGSYFNVVSYGVDRETERIDYDAMEKIAREARPKLIIGGGSASSRIIDFERMAAIAQGAHGRSCRGGCTSESGAVCRYRNNDYAQNFARTSRWYDHGDGKICEGR